MRAGAALGVLALSAGLAVVAFMAMLVVNQQSPAVLAPKTVKYTFPSPAQIAIQKLIDDYSMECHCEKGKPCDCAANAAKDVKTALRNAVERQFAPPNMYYRSRDGYAFRLRPFQRPKPKVHVDRPAPAPVEVYRRPTEQQPRDEPKPVKEPKVVNGLPPVPVSKRFVGDVDPHVLSAAHASSTSTRTSGKNMVSVHYMSAKARQFSQLLQLPILAQPSEVENEEEAAEDEDEQFYNSQWFSDWMDYSKLILSDGVLEKAEEDSHLPALPNAAVEMPYQLGQEVDYADWENAFRDDDAVPFRVVDGTDSNYPDLDANEGFPGAVLEGYGGESPEQEEFADYLAQEASREQAPAPTSVDGWLRDSPAYRR